MDVDAPCDNVYTNEKTTDGITSCFDSIDLLDNDKYKTQTARVQALCSPNVTTSKDDTMSLIPDLDDSNASEYKTPLIWQNVGVAAKGPRSAFSAGYQSKVVSRSATGSNTPANSYVTSSQKSDTDSKPKRSWLKVKKADSIEINEWAESSTIAQKNGWTGYGGQPDIYKRKQKAKTRGDSDDSDEADN